MSTDKLTIRGPNATYETEEKLGRGGFGNVYKATETKDDGTTQTVAIKVMDLSHMKKDGKDRFLIECDAMKAVSGLNHPNIVKILDSWSCEENQTAYIVMEFVEGENLSKLIKRKGEFDEETAKKLFVQLIDAVEHCHIRGVRHRDLKPGNIMVVETCGDYDIKVLDFGLASIFKEGEKTSPKLYTPVGTKIFRAREVSNEKLARMGYSGAAADVYSCGVTLLMMLTGLPYGYKDLEDLTDDVYRGITSPTYLGISVFAHHILRIMICDSSIRGTVSEIKNHRWLRPKN